MVPIGGRVWKRGRVQKRRVQRRGRASTNRHSPGDLCLYRLPSRLPHLRPLKPSSKKRMRLRAYPDPICPSRLVASVIDRLLELQAKVNHPFYRPSNPPLKVYLSHSKPSPRPKARVNPIYKVWLMCLHPDPSSPIRVYLQYPELDQSPSCWLDVDLLGHLDQDCQCCPNYARIGTSPIQRVSSRST